MIQSMTGYGRGYAARDGREITVELKSVNHRYLDVSMRLPRHLGFLEDGLRAKVGATLRRGHVDVYVNYRNTRTDARTIEVDDALVSQYVTAANAIARRHEVENDLCVSDILRLNDAVRITEAEEDRDAVGALALEAAASALDELKAMRAKEGERLCEDLLARAAAVLALNARVEERAPQVVVEYREKLTERVQALLGETEVDRARLATEIALFADRASIDEEITRLKSHVQQMREALASSEATGRRLDFLVQEMNREFNTIGSKANDAALVECVLSGKAEIERIREQVQNIE